MNKLINQVKENVNLIDSIKSHMLNDNIPLILLGIDDVNNESRWNVYYML